MFGFMKPKSGGGLTVKDAIVDAQAGKIVLIDVREPGEVRASGKARGAINLPMTVIAMKCDPRSPECIAELKSGKPVALYCASGGRSGMAAQALRRMGYADVHNLGGFSDWAAAGGPVER